MAEKDLVDKKEKGEERVEEKRKKTQRQKCK